MKLVKAYIRPMVLEDVYTELRNKGHTSMTVFEGEGTGQYTDPKNKHGSLNFPAMHTHVVKLEIAAESEDIESIVQTIQKHAHTRRKGDGIIFVTPIEQAIRIRDGEQGSDILN
ncbi:transcriptional regulator [Aliifodinibius salipaludis]|uniref:Transcriptional regulator n=1 Tax=Fodinibius salipaludis TaxID=2032627 RepID=A0A2A2GDY0_9BACT|nr:P-II family nitrogen regulator [Aliifodinibius salipaludis]PAU95075.1 transcriptional regulator [Aliifodinibius salipaludis]